MPFKTKVDADSVCLSTDPLLSEKEMDKRVLIGSVVSGVALVVIVLGTAPPTFCGYGVRMLSPLSWCIRFPCVIYSFGEQFSVAADFGAPSTAIAF